AYLVGALGFDQHRSIAESMAHMPECAVGHVELAENPTTERQGVLESATVHHADLPPIDRLAANARGPPSAKSRPLDSPDEPTSRPRGSGGMDGLVSTSSADQPSLCWRRSRWG